MQVQPEAADNYKKKYKTLKRKLRMLIYEQECFAEELRKAQRKLQRISRDKSFLLDRLLQYEEVDASATDTDVTASSGSEDEQPPPPKRKKTQPAFSVSSGVLSLNNSPGFNQSAPSSVYFHPPGSLSAAGDVQPKSKTKLSKKASKNSVSSSPSSTAKLDAVKSAAHSYTPGSRANAQAGFSRVEYERLNRLGASAFDPKLDIKASISGHSIKHAVVEHGIEHVTGAHGIKRTMTREELEEHLEMKSSAKTPFMTLEKMPQILPDNIFNDNSNSCDFGDNKTSDDEDLVIDMP